MLLMSDQPCFLPYIGYFLKMAAVDVFDLALWDQFSKGNYVHRVWVGPEPAKVRVNLLLESKDHVPLKDVKLAGGWYARAQEDLFKAHVGMAHWDEVWQVIEPGFADGGHRWLVDLNIALLWRLRDVLNVRTPMSISRVRPKNTATEEFIALCKQFPDCHYMSGVNGPVYIDMVQMMVAGVRLATPAWGETEPNSVVSLIASRGFDSVRQEIQERSQLIKEVL